MEKDYFKITERILKTIVITVLLLNVVVLFSQERVTISVLQDGKLAFIGDERGNEAFTPDLVFRLGLEGNDTDIGYAAAILEVEYAQLKGGDYTRWSAGYQLNGYVKDFTLSVSAQFGVIARWNLLPFTTVLNGDVTWMVHQNIGIVLSNQWTYRTDLEVKQLRYSLMGGIKVNIGSTKYKINRFK